MMQDISTKTASGMAPRRLRGIRRALPVIAAAVLALPLSGCLSLSPDVPDSLLVLTPARTAPAGAAIGGQMSDALAVEAISVPQKLDVTRVPVTTTQSEIAYLQDAKWVEKPGALFARLVAETIRAGGKRMVFDTADIVRRPSTVLGGRLLDMGYDAGSSSVVVRFDGILTHADGTVATRRFESTVPGVTPKVGAVGPALNRAANDVAQQVADWVG
ncbi:MAG: ABC-type transport auxiliary lipoprotein family protein [Novosphingobium sp.]